MFHSTPGSRVIKQRRKKKVLALNLAPTDPGRLQTHSKRRPKQREGRGERGVCVRILDGPTWREKANPKLGAFSPRGGPVQDLVLTAREAWGGTMCKRLRGRGEKQTTGDEPLAQGLVTCCVSFASLPARKHGRIETRTQTPRQSDGGGRSLQNCL